MMMIAIIVMPFFGPICGVSLLKLVWLVRWGKIALKDTRRSLFVGAICGVKLC